ncbi:hypothetical protein AB0O28_37270 [Microbispora sp. NPDC088329]|uniref:hypothetical protein n=1 Tax=Microbispora sp. NPDC088329 TaxID=3154869 RepID=UPI00342457EA
MAARRLTGAASANRLAGEQVTGEVAQQHAQLGKVNAVVVVRDRFEQGGAPAGRPYGLVGTAEPGAAPGEPVQAEGVQPRHLGHRGEEEVRALGRLRGLSQMGGPGQAAAEVAHGECDGLAVAGLLRRGHRPLRPAQRGLVPAAHEVHLGEAAEEPRVRRGPAGVRGGEQLEQARGHRQDGRRLAEQALAEEDLRQPVQLRREPFTEVLAAWYGREIGLLRLRQPAVLQQPPAVCPRGQRAHHPLVVIHPVCYLHGLRRRRKCLVIAVELRQGIGDEVQSQRELCQVSDVLIGDPTQAADSLKAVLHGLVHSVEPQQRARPVAQQHRDLEPAVGVRQGRQERPCAGQAHVADRGGETAGVLGRTFRYSSGYSGMHP